MVDMRYVNTRYMGMIWKNLPLVNLYYSGNDLSIASDYNNPHRSRDIIQSIIKGSCRAVFSAVTVAYLLTWLGADLGPNPLEWREIGIRRESQRKTEEKNYQRLSNTVKQLADTDRIPGLNPFEMLELYRRAGVSIDIELSRTGTFIFPKLTEDDLRRVIESYKTERESK